MKNNKVNNQFSSWLEQAHKISDEALNSDKRGFISLLSRCSYHVPSVIDRKKYLIEILLINKKIDSGIIAVFFSTARVDEFKRLSECFSDALLSIYKDNKHTKLLDYVISNDWGKFLLLQNKQLVEILKYWFDIEKYAQSDEIAVLLIKLATTPAGRYLIDKAVGYDFFAKNYINILSGCFGKNGGLIKNAAFMTRREFVSVDVDLSIDVDVFIDEIFHFIENKRFNSLLRFSVASLVIRSFKFNASKVIMLLGEFDAKAAYYCLMLFGGYHLAWSRIQLGCLRYGINKYESRSIGHNDLLSLYGSIDYKNKSKKQETKVVGVIITTFNPDLDLLEKSVSSIWNQTYKKIKICIVDDCSSAIDYKLLVDRFRAFDKNKIILLRNKENIGQYMSRNKAIELLSDCELIAIQDDDDISHPERIQKQVEVMDANADVMISLTRQARFTNNLKYVPDRINPTEFDSSPASTMFRRALVERIGGFANVRSRGDVEFIARTRINYDQRAIYTIDAVLYLMRAAPHTVSSTKDYFLKTQLDVFRRSMGDCSTSSCLNPTPYSLLC